MKKKYNFENAFKKALLNIKSEKYREFLKIFWNDLDRLILDRLSLHKYPKSFVSRNDILLNNLNKTKSRFLLSILSLFFSKYKYKSKLFINYNEGIAWNNNPIIPKYAKKKNINLQYSRNYDWFDQKKNIKFEEKKFGSFIFFKLKKIIYSFDNSKKLKKDLIYDLNLFYSWANHQLEFNSKLKMPKIFFSATMGSPLNRIMAINVLKKGGKVIVFDHGVGAGLKKYGGERVIYDLVYSSVFVTFNKIMKQAVQENVKLLSSWLKLYRKNSLKIDYLKFQTNNEKQANFKLNQVIFVLATTEEKFFKGSKGMYQNDIIFNLVKKVFYLCKKKNIKFYAKIHPFHTSNKFIRLLRSKKIEIYNGRFEENSWENSLFVFDNLETSAFKSACITDKPLIYFEQKRLSLTNTVKKEFDKRCEEIKWKFNNKNIEFSDLSFYRAIEKSVHKRNSKNLINNMY